MIPCVATARAVPGKVCKIFPSFGVIIFVQVSHLLFVSLLLSWNVHISETFRRQYQSNSRMHTCPFDNHRQCGIYKGTTNCSWIVGGTSSWTQRNRFEVEGTHHHLFCTSIVRKCQNWSSIHPVLAHVFQTWRYRVTRCAHMDRRRRMVGKWLWTMMKSLKQRLARIRTRLGIQYFISSCVDGQI